MPSRSPRNLRLAGGKWRREGKGGRVEGDRRFRDETLEGDCRIKERQKNDRAKQFAKQRNKAPRKTQKEIIQHNKPRKFPSGKGFLTFPYGFRIISREMLFIVFGEGSCGNDFMTP